MRVPVPVWRCKVLDDPPRLLQVIWIWSRHEVMERRGNKSLAPSGLINSRPVQDLDPLAFLLSLTAQIWIRHATSFPQLLTWQHILISFDDNCRTMTSKILVLKLPRESFFLRLVELIEIVSVQLFFKRQWWNNSCWVTFYYTRVWWCLECIPWTRYYWDVYLDAYVWAIVSV